MADHNHDIHNIDNAVARLSKEHKLITDYAARYTKQKARKNDDFFSDLNEFIKFLRRDLLNHFRLEELVFFPAALNGAPDYDTTLMVLNLQKEHGALEKDLKRIVAKQKQVEPGTLDENLLKKLDNFFDALKAHAKRELMELFPMIDENKKCKALLKRYLEDMKSGINGA